MFDPEVSAHVVSVAEGGQQHAATDPAATAADAPPAVVRVCLLAAT